MGRYYKITQLNYYALYLAIIGNLEIDEEGCYIGASADQALLVFGLKPPSKEQKNTAFTDKQKAEIRRLRNSENRSYQYIADKYDVSITTIHRIINGRKVHKTMIKGVDYTKMAKAMAAAVEIMDKYDKSPEKNTLKVEQDFEKRTGIKRSFSSIKQYAKENRNENILPDRKRKAADKQ